MKKESIVEFNLLVLVNLILLGLVFFVGFEMSEKSNCTMQGGQYSWDMGVCNLPYVKIKKGHK